jgi:RES domain-containing protein
MNAFESKDAYWDFARTVRTERRFIFDGKAGNFLAAVREASKSRVQLLKSGHPLWRAQVGSKFAPANKMGIEEEHPYPKARMIPKPKFVKDGSRANPTGFAYLYLASTPETALAEMRPWVAESVTLAIFEIKKNIQIVVCRAGAENWEERLFEKRPSAMKIDQYVWNDISTAFARPVNREDQENAYLPTQILAEAFRAEGFDGLAYRSGLERGTNIVLFNVHVAKLTHRFVYTLKKVRYDFEAAPNYGIYRKKDGTYQCLTEIQTESP